MMLKEIRCCDKHGYTEFALYLSNGKERWKCLKCLTEATQKRRDKLKYMALLYKGNKCQCCGYDKCKSALEFHHVDSNEKDFGISAKGYTRSWADIKKELDKCVLVCSNCHREIHEKLRECPNIISFEENVKDLEYNKVIHYCPDCGKEVTKEGNKCPECAAKSSRKVDRPERDELKQLIRTKSFLEIGRNFGVSDNAVKKWCISYNLPSKKSEIKTISEDDWKLI